MSHESHSIAKEAAVICSYLVKEACPEKAEALYQNIISKGDVSTGSDSLCFAMRHTWSIGYLDAGLAFLRPQDELRRRIYIMFAVLETIPEISMKFLPQARSPFYMIVMTGIGLRAVLRALAGIILIKVIRIA